MLRRAALAALFSGAVGALSGQARAGGAWISSTSLTPVEQRVAVAAGPARTTLWTSLRFEAGGGPLGIIVPAPPDASLDISSDAWFEALDVATAPRIFPPNGANPYCPGKSGSATPFEIAGQTGHAQSLTRPPPPLTVLADAAAVSAWATQHSLVVPGKLMGALSALSGVRFVAVAYGAPPGPGVTPTIRVSMTGTPAVLPLALTSAGGSELRVTAWTIGPGEADLIGAVKVAVSPSSLAWKAGLHVSNYDGLRDTALASGSDTFVVESAGHGALAQEVSIAQGTAFIDGVVTTFFERAAAYGDGSFDSASCIATATPLLDSQAVVAAVCPQAAYGIVDPGTPCAESPGPAEIQPDDLRCGAGADDLAVALSGLTPSGVWVTRHSLAIAASASGVDTSLGFTGGAVQSPVLYAKSVDLSDCGDAGTSGSSSSGTTTGSSGTTSGGMSSGGLVIGGGDGLGIVADVIDTTVNSGCDCSGSPGSTDTSSSSDGCSGSGSGDSCSSDNSGSSGDSCGSGSSGSSDSSSSDSCSSNSSGSGDSCGSGSSGSSGESCGSGSSGGSSGCSGGSSGGSSSFNCATAGSRKVRAPRASIMMMLALTVIAPLRRRARPRRRG